MAFLFVCLFVCLLTMTHSHDERSFFLSQFDHFFVYISTVRKYTQFSFIRKFNETVLEVEVKLELFGVG